MRQSAQAGHASSSKDYNDAKLLLQFEAPERSSAYKPRHRLRIIIFEFLNLKIFFFYILII